LEEGIERRGNEELVEEDKDDTNMEDCWCGDHTTVEGDEVGDCEGARVHAGVARGNDEGMVESGGETKGG
jgi:hypothetical protein